MKALPRSGKRFSFAKEKDEEKQFANIVPNDVERARLCETFAVERHQSFVDELAHMFETKEATSLSFTELKNKVNLEKITFAILMKVLDPTYHPTLLPHIDKVRLHLREMKATSTLNMLNDELSKLGVST